MGGSAKVNAPTPGSPVTTLHVEYALQAGVGHGATHSQELEQPGRPRPAGHPDVTHVFHPRGKESHRSTWRKSRHTVYNACIAPGMDSRKDDGDAAEAQGPESSSSSHKVGHPPRSRPTSLPNPVAQILFTIRFVD